MEVLIVSLKGLKVGFALTGSFCTFSKVLPQIERLVKEGCSVYPIMSYSALNTDTRFGSAKEWKDKITAIAGHEPITTIKDAEPIGPDNFLDVVIIAPCTGNTLAKLANGITDTPVLMAVKAQLRNKKPVILAISTNDGLSMNAKNLGLILNTKLIYLVPFGQDNPEKKANSLVAHMELIPETIEYAMKNEQVQPLLREYRQ
ncbi:MAG: dipicolinate synthase subunit [Clostridia bacterium]|jgi:dipicolinate synthase subunit B|nr:dipicolinate synthase subunit [Clostridia bacterium]